jgi:methionine-rich copper-binding protein CopC
MRSPLFSRIAALTLTAIVALTVFSPGVLAHAVIIRSTPAVDAVLPSGDTAVELQYNSRIDHQRSRLTLFGADGKPSPVAIQPDSAADVIVANLSGLAPGQYRLRWQVLAVDGHLTRGEIPFSVKAP